MEHYQYRPSEQHGTGQRLPRPPASREGQQRRGRHQPEQVGGRDERQQQKTGPPLAACLTLGYGSAATAAAGPQVERELSDQREQRRRQHRERHYAAGPAAAEGTVATAAPPSTPMPEEI
ncbi:MAG TPA: hypothetical protein VFY87_30745 [Geminicoccaceae bacterium]|nr:hypothetical protein [Geminicoccaceae bacterium]